MASRLKSITKFSGLLSRSKSVSAPPTTSPYNAPNLENAPADSPEANVGRTVRLFCESGSMSNGGEEVLHLPVIVEAAESSPVAAAAAAQQVRKFLTKEWATKPHVQYNAIMLIRILCDNPGPSFTRNFDKQFVSTIKDALRNCKDASTQQILRETLDSLEANKQFQEGLEGLIQMWRKEKGQHARLSQGYSTGSQAATGFNSDPQNPYSYRQPTRSIGQGERHHSSSRNRQLPPPIELASRIEEAKNTAKILLQLIQSTPSEEILGNDLIREFADRCQSAQRSMQGYIACDTPPPDDDTMLTLIETNEQLSLASTRYQRSVLSARRAVGLGSSPSADMNANAGPYAPPTMPPPAPQAQNENLFACNAPPRQPPNTFGSGDESYLPPPGPPPRQQVNASSLNSPSLTNRDEPSQAPPIPPQSLLRRLDSRENQPPVQSYSPTQAQAPQLPFIEHSNDPFANPVEHERNPPPLAYASDANANQAQHPAHRPHSQTFSIDAEPQYASSHSRDISESYSQRPNPAMMPGGTPSYIGRQTSAVNGLTMHGAGIASVSEIDGHSEVGRTDVTQARRESAGSQNSDDPYAVSPIETRTSQRAYRY